MKTSLKTWTLLSLSALLSITPTETEVVDSMSQCAEFLLDRTPPEIPGVLQNGNITDQNRYKTICQTYNDRRRFVTLYDTRNKIPVFSAYRYRGATGSRPKTPWKVEPQVGSLLLWSILTSNPRSPCFRLQKLSRKDSRNQKILSSYSVTHYLSGFFTLTEVNLFCTFTST